MRSGQRSGFSEALLTRKSLPKKACLVWSLLFSPFHLNTHITVISRAQAVAKIQFSVCNVYYIYCICNSIQRLCKQNSEVPGVAFSVVLVFSQCVFTIIREIKNGLVMYYCTCYSAKSFGTLAKRKSISLLSSK